jgi:hypothetical protein
VLKQVQFKRDENVIVHGLRKKKTCSISVQFFLKDSVLQNVCWRKPVVVSIFS